MLPAYIIFKGLTKPPKCVYPPNVVAVACKSGTMSTGLMIDYIEKILKPVIGSNQALLLLDQFAAHSTTPVQEKYAECNISPVLIPGGFTHCLQPLDVSINKPLKDRFRHEWATWMSTTKPEYTRGGNRQRPTYQNIVDMLSRSLAAIDQQSMISRAFQCCGVVRDFSILPDHLFVTLNDRLRTVVTMANGSFSSDHKLKLRQIVTGGNSIAQSSIEEFCATLAARPPPVTTPVAINRTNRRASNRRAKESRQSLPNSGSSPSIAPQPVACVSTPVSPAISTSSSSSSSPFSPFSINSILGSSSSSLSSSSSSTGAWSTTTTSYVTTDYAVSDGFSECDTSGDSSRVFFNL